VAAVIAVEVWLWVLVRINVAVVFVVIGVHFLWSLMPSPSYFPIFPSCFKHDDEAEAALLAAETGAFPPD
jgi:hypothetical protein